MARTSVRRAAKDQTKTYKAFRDSERQGESPGQQLRKDVDHAKAANALNAAIEARRRSR